MYQELARKQRAKLQLKGKGKSKLSKQAVPAADDLRELMFTFARIQKNVYMESLMDVFHA